MATAPPPDRDDQPNELTLHLQRIAAGDPGAAEAVLPMVYDDLKAIAREMMRGQGPDHTLQTTALVHELWLKLTRTGGMQNPWEGRSHFFGVAAKAMRHILINHARDRQRQKRGGAVQRVPLDGVLENLETNTGDVVALDDALVRLATEDRRAAQVVEFRVFGGMTIEEVAEALGLGPTTVKAAWRFGRAWLRRELGADDSDG